jgi:hypothetical protein
MNQKKYSFCTPHELLSTLKNAYFCIQEYICLRNVPLMEVHTFITHLHAHNAYFLSVLNIYYLENILRTFCDVRLRVGIGGGHPILPFVTRKRGRFVSLSHCALISEYNSSISTGCGTLYIHMYMISCTRVEKYAYYVYCNLLISV